MMNREDLRQARGVLPYKSKDPVLPNPAATGQFLFVALRPDLDEAAVRAFLGSLQAATDDLRAHLDGGQRVATVATGFSGSFFTSPTSPGAPRFASLTAVPAGLQSPPAVDGSQGVVADLVCYVVSTSEGCAARFISAVASDPAVAAVSLERGYQRLDQTEPFGYRDGVRNVEDKAKRPEVVFIDTDALPEEPWWAHDGTYLAYLKIEQHLEVMKGLSGPEQDDAIGRSRDGRRLDATDRTGRVDVRAESDFTGDVPPADSHVRKTGPRGQAHDTVRIFRRGLPYYEVGPEGRVRQGLHFASFQSTLDAFDVIFNRWMSNPNFPRGGPGQPDRLLARGLITVLRHGFFLVPPDTDEPIGEVMFGKAPKTKPAKTGRVAVRKRLLDGSTGQPHKGELSGFTFRILDANGQPLGGDFTTDGKGHALSNDVPVGQPLTLEEVGTQENIPAAAPIQVTVNNAREVVKIVNTVPVNTPY